MLGFFDEMMTAELCCGDILLQHQRESQVKGNRFSTFKLVNLSVSQGVNHQ